jgi:hypothetical protein
LKYGVKGSFTVEAAFLFPIIVLLIAFVLQTAIGWYEEVEQTSVAISNQQQIDSVSVFLRDSLGDKILDTITNKN